MPENDEHLTTAVQLFKIYGVHVAVEHLICTNKGSDAMITDCDMTDIISVNASSQIVSQDVQPDRHQLDSFCVDNETPSQYESQSELGNAERELGKRRLQEPRRPATRISRSKPVFQVIAAK